MLAAHMAAIHPKERGLTCVTSTCMTLILPRSRIVAGRAAIVAVGSQGYHAGPPQALHSMVVEKYGPKCVFLVYTLYPKNEKLLVFYPKGEMVVGFKPPETWRKNGKRWRPRWL